MHVLDLMVFCFLFTVFTISIVYFGAFRKPSPNKKDFSFLGIEDDRQPGNRKTSYFIFYHPQTQRDLLTPIRLGRDRLPTHVPKDLGKMNLNSLTTWLGLIALFSFVIVIAAKTGYWLFQVYSWLN